MHGQAIVIPIVSGAHLELFLGVGHMVGSGAARVTVMSGVAKGG